MKYGWEIPDPWPTRVRDRWHRALCQVFGHPKDQERLKMYDVLCGRCDVVLRPRR